MRQQSQRPTKRAKKQPRLAVKWSDFVNPTSRFWIEALFPDGRLSRSHFAFFWIVGNLLIGVGYYVAAFVVYNEVQMPFLLVGMVLGFGMFILGLWFSIVAGIRRLHDLNITGWYLLLAFVPLVNLWVILRLLFDLGKADADVD